MFDQQAFTEVVGIAAAAIAQAGIVGSHGGPNNLQKFRVHHPPTFIGGGDPMVADHWFIQIEKVLEAMEITSNTTRIRLAAFQLESEAQVWWNWARTSRTLKAMTWARVLFNYGASHSFIAASVVIELGLGVETLEEPLNVSSPLGIRARIGMICRGCELEISGTLLTVDLRIMDMSEFNVTLGMD